MKIAVVGAGPAGLYFALLAKLRDPERDVTVYERQPPDSTSGWGVVFWDDLLSRLYTSDAESAREIEQTAFRWITSIVELRGHQEVDTGASGHSIPRQALTGILTRRALELGVHIEYHHEVRDRSELADADLIVAADGVSSRLRDAAAARLGTEVHVGANKYIWLGADKVFSAFTFPFVNTDSGWMWAHAYGISDHSSTFVVECPPQTWAGLGLDRLSPNDSLHVLESVFADQLQGARLIDQIRDRPAARWLNFRTITNARWYDGNVVLVGDAAHTTHFTIGSGTKLAINDDVALADSLDRHRELPAALAAYEAGRASELREPQTEAHFSALWFANIGRYIDLDPDEFFTLLRSRRSPLLARMPPRLYHRLHGLRKQSTGWALAWRGRGS